MIPENLLLSLPSIVITLSVIIGGLFVFRRAYVKQLGELQERVINAYKEQDESQQKELKRLRREIVAMRAAFKQLGMEIEINGTSITLIDGHQQGKRKRIIQLPADEETLEN